MKQIRFLPLQIINQAARDTGALREAKDKLEKRVEELTWRLQLEKRQRVSSFIYTGLISSSFVYTFIDNLC